MTLKNLLEAVKTEMVKAVNFGLLNYDLSDLGKIKADYLSGVEGSRALSVLAEKLERLICVKNEDRAGAFLELNEIIQKLSVSLADFKKVRGGEELVLPELSTPAYTYREVKDLLKALAQKSGARLSLIRESLARETYKAYQLLPYFVENLTESYGEVSQLIAEEILPYYGKNAVPLVKTELNFKGGKVQERILTFLLQNLDFCENEQLVAEILEKGDLELKKFILKTADASLFSKADLKSILSSRSRELKDLAQGLIEKYS